MFFFFGWSRHWNKMLVLYGLPTLLSVVKLVPVTYQSLLYERTSWMGTM